MASKVSNNRNLKEWEVGEDYELLKIVGSGSYGYVCEAIHKPTGRKVAIKKLNKVFEDNIDCKRILREVKLLKELQHPYVVELLDILEPKDPKHFDTLYIVLEFAQSDIKKLVKSAIHLNQIHIQTLIYNLLCGLKYIHSSDVIHRDLKPANVLLNEDCSVKVCDFGLARSIAGVESAKYIIETKPTKMTDDRVSSSDEEETKILNSEKAKITKSDTTATSATSSPEPITEKQEEEKKKEVSKKLIRTKDLRKNMKRELTGHVVTRWYRAPEIILLEKDYGAAIDMWSVGCIFAELLSMMKENAATYLDRSPLFPGSSCFPLSPDHNSTTKRNGFPFSQSDQLNVIFDVIGTPLEDDCSFVTDSKAVEYLKSFPIRKRIDLKKLYPAAGEDALDLLNRILVFNPYFRMTLDDCLNHPYLAKVRDRKKEVISTKKVQLAFEKEGELDGKRLRELFLEEIAYYKKIRDEKKKHDHGMKVEK